MGWGGGVQGGGWGGGELIHRYDYVGSFSLAHSFI